VANLDIVITIKIYLVNGTNMPDIHMSGKEFSGRVIGDDWGPPVESWFLEFADDNGNTFRLGIDPKDKIPKYWALAGGDSDAGDSMIPSDKQEWALAAIESRLESITTLLPTLHPSQRERAGSALEAVRRSIE
jgi:hypothetical protein